MVAIEDQDPIEALTTDAANQALHVGVRSGCSNRCPDDPDRLGAEYLVERGRELAVAVVDQEPDRL